MRRLATRTLLASLAAIASTLAIIAYASMHQHLPDRWPRVYVASNCAASEFTMMVAEQSEISIATIPTDDGEISHRACYHTSELLMKDRAMWSALRILPDALTCNRLIRDGSKWMSAHRYDEWPVFVGPSGEVHVGASIEGLRVAGLDIDNERYTQMLAQFEGK